MTEPMLAAAAAQVRQGTMMQLRQAIESLGLDPDHPTRWAWDPWPDRSNAGRYRGQAGGENSTPAFMSGQSPPRLLEAHMFWKQRGEEAHLLILPLDANGGLRWHWDVRQATAKVAP
jgi:hypothetical protein